MEEGPVWTGLHVVNDARLEVDVEGTRDVFPAAGLGEEGRETTVRGGWRALGKATIRLGTKRMRFGRVEGGEGHTLRPCSRV